MTPQNDWDVVRFRHEDSEGFVSGWYGAYGDGMSWPIRHSLADDFPFFSVVQLRNGQIIRVRKKQ